MGRGSEKSPENAGVDGGRRDWNRSCAEFRGTAHVEKQTIGRTFRAHKSSNESGTISEGFCATSACLQGDKLCAGDRSSFLTSVEGRLEKAVLEETGLNLPSRFALSKPSLVSPKAESLTQSSALNASSALC
jgi:hypothetical protein